MRRIFACSIIVLAAGCAATRYTPVLQYSLTPVVQVRPAEKTDRELAVRPLDAARPYRANIVVFHKPNVIESVDGKSWAEWPRDVVTRALYDAVTASGRFKDVGMAADLQLPDLMLTGEVRAFDLIAHEEPWIAVCEARLEVREVGTGKLRWAKTIRKQAPLAANDEAQLPYAMGEAVSQVVNEAAGEIAGL